MNSSPTVLEEDAEAHEGDSLSLCESYTTHYVQKNPCEMLIKKKNPVHTGAQDALTQDTSRFHCAVLQRSAAADHRLVKGGRSGCACCRAVGESHPSATTARADLPQQAPSPC